MAFLSQAMNSFAQTPILGLLSEIPNMNTVAARILTTSSAVITVGTAVKLVAGTDSLPVVDACTGPTDGPVFGVIPYNERKNTYSAGDVVNVALSDSYIYLKASAAIARGDKVTTTLGTTTADPLVTTVATATTQYVTGIAIDVAAAASDLIRVRIAPSFNSGV